MLKSDIEGLSKTELKNKLIQMGVSLDNKDHPNDYYAKLIIEKSKKLKIGLKEKKEKIMRGKRKRGKGHKIGEKCDPDYEEEQSEEEEEIGEKEGKKKKRKRGERDPNYKEEEIEEEEDIIKEKKKYKRRKGEKDPNYKQEESEEEEEISENGGKKKKRKRKDRDPNYIEEEIEEEEELIKEKKKYKRRRGEKDPNYKQEESEEEEEISEKGGKKKKKKKKRDPNYIEEEIEEEEEYYNNPKKKKRKKIEKINEKEKELKKKMLDNQKKLREENENKNKNPSSEKEKNKKVNEVLEDMCIYGTITKKEIKEEKIKNPNKFISTSKALQLENQDQGIFALGLLSNNLEKLGIETAIEKDENKEEEDAAATCLQFLTNGMCKKKKYDLHFDLGEKRNEELLNNEEEYEKFKNNLKLKLSRDYNIPIDKIIITLPQKGSFSVQVIFQSDEFNDLNLNQFKEKFRKEKEFKELCNLKEIHSDVIMGGCKLSKNQLDPRGNRVEGWGIGEMRGGKPYDPPLGWNGIGLKVMDKYGDNTWIGMNNSEGEWCVAYHGIGSGEPSDKVKDITGKIFKGAFKAGSRQAHSNCPDQFHPGKLVGDGVYCTPKISTAEDYAGISDINGKSYKTVFMVRVKPSAIRHCDQCSDSKEPYVYWVVNGTTDEIRPYRILYKC